MDLTLIIPDSVQVSSGIKVKDFLSRPGSFARKENNGVFILYSPLIFVKNEDLTPMGSIAGEKAESRVTTLGSP